MTFSSKPLFLALTLVAGATAAHAAPAGQSAQASRRVTAGDRLDFAAVAKAHRQAVLADGLPGVYARLDAAVGAERPRALLTKAAMKWQDGDLDAANLAVNAALDLGESLDAMLLKARLLDVQGQAGAAAVWYGKAREASRDPAERAFLDLRLAVIGVTGRKPQALVEFARGKSPELTGRAAAALGLLGDPKGAIGLYSVQGDAGGVYAGEIRLAGWAIAAGDMDAAADFAWKAFEAAGNSGDQRYALALLVEAFRDKGDLAEAVKFLAAKPAGVEVDQARLDLLLELARYDEAVALVARSGAPELRQRLLGVLKAAGRESEVEAEYRRLIAERPGEARWYEDLATLYLGRGDREKGVAVYGRLFDANRGKVEVLTEAARRMIAMGLSDEALARLGGAAADPALAVPVKQFLAETALDQGRDAEAEALLGDLQRLAPDNAPLMIDLADGYERLGRKDRALEILAGLEKQGRTLDYDQKAHMADLAFDAGRADEALTRWRRLWDETLLPARKAYLQRQIIKAGKQLGRLEAIAGELEARVADGSAKQGDLNLLIEIRITQEDGVRAQAALEAYAAGRKLGEVEKLEQLSAVQARLRQYAALNQSLGRLVEIDPQNADAHLRRLVVNTLRYPIEGQTEADRTRTIEALLTRMRTTGLSPAETAQFAASTYASNGQPDKALDQYRRALALAPDDLDSLLQLTALLAQRGEARQAVALLQYEVEVTGDPAALGAAIGGLLDVLSSDPNEPGMQGAPADLVQASMAWAKRAVLERILRDGDDVRMASLLADVAQERGEYDLQLRALEASLPVAGDQRPAVLRQLISLSGGGSEGARGGGDVHKKAVLGRRLIALKREYPPEVYADLARTLLAQGDLPGAERAFALVGDVGGLVNTDAIKGEAYAKSGHADLALSSYKLALLQDQDNLGLIVSAGVLMEQAGETDAAGALYWRGLRLLVQRQTLLNGGAGENSSLDVAQYYPTLMEGVLLTWPANRDERAARLAMWRGLFGETVAAARSDAPLADQARLGLALKVNRRLAEVLDDPTLAALEAPLADKLAADPAYGSGLAVYRGVTGLGPAIAADTGGDWPMRGLREQAAATGNFELKLALAFQTGEKAELGALMDAAIQAEDKWRKASAGLGNPGPQPPMLVTLLFKAAAVGTPALIREQVLAPLDASPVRDVALFDVFRIDPESFQSLEQAAGKPLLTDAALIQGMVERGNDPLPVAGAARGGNRRRPDPLGLMITRFKTAQMLDFYGALVARAERTGSLSGLQAVLSTQLLAKPLSQEEQARFLPLLNRDLALQRPDDPASAAFAAPRLLAFDTPPENRELLLRAARAVAQRYADGQRLPKVLEAWFAGDRSTAFRELTDLQADTSIAVRSSDYASRIVEARFQAERQAEIAAFMAADRVEPAAVERFYRRFVLSGNQQGDPAARLATFAKLAALDPGNAVYLGGLLYAQAQKQDWAALVATARPYADRNPDNPDVATVLGLAYRVLGRGADADAVTRAGSVDLDDADWLTQMLNRAETRQGGAFEPGFRELFPLVWAAYQAAQPDAGVVKAMSARQGSQEFIPLEGGEQGPLARLAERPEAARGMLRGLWRNASPRGREDGDLQERTALIAALSGGDGAPGGASKLVVARPDLAAEVEAYLAAMEPEARQRQVDLYAVLAQALQAQGVGKARLDGLLARLGAGQVTDHELMLLAALARSEKLRLDAGQRQALERRLAAAPILSAQQRLSFAVLLANGGDANAAQALMHGAVMQALYISSIDYQVAGARPITAQDIMGALAAWNDVAAARRAHAALQALLAQDPAMRSARPPLEPLPAFPETKS